MRLPSAARLIPTRGGPPLSSHLLPTSPPPPFAAASYSRTPASALSLTLPPSLLQSTANDVNKIFNGGNGTNQNREDTFAVMWEPVFSTIPTLGCAGK